MAHPGDDLIKAPATAHRRSDLITRAQILLPIVAALGIGGFWLVEWLWRGEARYSPGPLAAVHGQWDNQCSACHLNSAPLASQNWYARVSQQTHVADAQCRSCHSGPPHHRRERSEDIAGCTACHRDHLGSPGQLLAVNDTHCTRCHADLKNHTAPDTSPSPASTDGYRDVAGFDLSRHPEFAKLRDKTKDPGTIAFNHARHLAPGMGLDAAKPGPFTLAQIPPEFREAYRLPNQTDDNSAVVLDCRACHRADARDFPVAKGQLDSLPEKPLRPARTTGADMAPIVYEQHCQACHPLSIDRKIPGDASTELLTVRHRQQPKEMLGSLRGHYTNLLFQGLWTPREKKSALLPGKFAAGSFDPKALAKDADAQAEAASLALMMDQHQKTIERKTLGQTTCQKCHPSIEPSKGIHQSIPPGNIPQVWLEHARFDHVSHRAVECRACHAAAYDSTKSSDVMLPGIATCVTCHGPSRGHGPTATGGARFDCIACHSYHQGDQPLAGRGSEARQPATMKTIVDFLQGK